MLRLPAPPSRLLLGGSTEIPASSTTGQPPRRAYFEDVIECSDDDDGNGTNARAMQSRNDGNDENADDANKRNEHGNEWVVDTGRSRTRSVHFASSPRHYSRYYSNGLDYDPEGELDYDVRARHHQPHRHNVRCLQVISLMK
jgi:hypothetical protein